jgi:hypothetical protein
MQQNTIQYVLFANKHANTYIHTYIQQNLYAKTMQHTQERNNTHIPVQWGLYKIYPLAFINAHTYIHIITTINIYYEKKTSSSSSSSYIKLCSSINSSSTFALHTGRKQCLFIYRHIIANGENTLTD